MVMYIYYIDKDSGKMANSDKEIYMFQIFWYLCTETNNSEFTDIYICRERINVDTIIKIS